MTRVFLVKRMVLLVTLVLLASGSTAGCLGEGDEPPTSDSLKRGTTRTPTEPPGDGSKVDQNEVNQTLGKRWHFHNYWGLHPNLTLLDEPVTIGLDDPSVSAVPTRATVGSATFGLPYGTIVPPETGRITVAVNYTASPALGPLNVSYKPANLAEFVPAGRVEANGEVTISVTHDMTDVPHRGRSVWEFRLSAAPTAENVGIANGTVHVNIVATIGRPIFVDPPHIDHWNGSNVVPVVSAERDVHAAKAHSDAGYVSVDGTGAVERRTVLAEFPVVDGAVVPEGTKVVLVRLSWQSDLPPQAYTPAIAFSEENSGSSGVPAPVSDKPGERLYRIEVVPRQTDSPYANQSTWRIHVFLEGDVTAFSGTIRVDAWASSLLSGEAEFPGVPPGALLV